MLGFFFLLPAQISGFSFGFFFFSFVLSAHPPISFFLFLFCCGSSRLPFLPVFGFIAF